MKLTAENVTNTVFSCLFEDGENIENSLKVEGVMLKMGFHPARIKQHENDIAEMLSQLPESFQLGMSFLNMCEDKNGDQWADLHKTMDELVCLGLAIGKLSFQFPREMDCALPGGVPYIWYKP